MAREVIDAIRQAELEAAERSAAAEKKAEEILKKAQEDAAAMKKEMTRKAREDTVKAEEEAREACRGMMAEAENRKLRKEPGWKQFWRDGAGRPWKGLWRN